MGDFRTRLKTTQHDLQTSNGQVQTLNSHVNELTQHLSDAEEQDRKNQAIILDWEKRFELRGRELEATNGRVAALETESADAKLRLEKELGQYNARLSDTTASLTAKDNELGRLTSQIASLQPFQSQSAQLEKELLDAQIEVETLKQQLADPDIAAAKSLRLQVDEKSKQITQLNDELFSLRRTLAARNVELEELQAQKRALDAQLQPLNLKIGELQRSLNVSAESTTQFESTSAQLRGQIADLEQQIAKLSAERDNLNNWLTASTEG